MNAIRQFSPFAVVGIVLTISTLTFADAPTAPDERDRQVIECLLLHLLEDTKFDMTRSSLIGANIVLDESSPLKTGFLSSDQIRSDFPNRTLPSHAVSDMRQRNTPANSKPHTYDSVKASYADLKFDARIVVSNLEEIREKSRNKFRFFENAHPKARGWLASYLPGYSRDGNLAIVRAGAGPSDHGAMITAVLEKSGDKWVVKWYQISRYL